ncbi:MAG: spore cortex biosynthesis protein YabQ [Mahellales bacterium]|jgi:spore cortex biosynthesis protein YabQ
MDSETINQTIVFGYIVVCGGIVGMAFDIYRFFKIKWAFNKIITGFIDLLFCMAAALLFFYIIYHINYGQVRGYIIIGFIIGWVLYKLTISKPVVIILEFLYNIVCTIIRQIMRVVIWPIRPWLVLFKPKDNKTNGKNQRKKPSHSKGLFSFFFNKRKTI